jgi:hypothetical protein
MGLAACYCALAAACQHAAVQPRNAAIAAGLQKGMTEQQLAGVSNPRVPDRVIVTTCGTQTPRPFACKVLVFVGGSRGAQQEARLAVVFEQVGGQWKVSQWL